MKKNLPIAAALIGGIALASVVTPHAAAANIEQKCTPFRAMCLHYNSIEYGLGAEFGSGSDIASFNPSVNGGTNYLFTTGSKGSSGAGRNVWNNAASARNLHLFRSFTVYFNSHYKGNSDIVNPLSQQNLASTKNQDTSMRWV